MSEVIPEEGVDLSRRSLVIVGSGPAGYTAALYAARANLDPLVLEGSSSAGGALMTTTEVENFPGFPAGIQGPDLVASMRAQAERFGAELVRDDVLSVVLDGRLKTVVTADSGTYEAPAVIIATGSRYRHLGLEEETRLSGHGVSWCATCDGAFFRDQDVAVVGGGDSALEQAGFLSMLARSVTVIHRRGELRASAVLQERALANPKITFRWNTEVVGLDGDARLAGVRVREIGGPGDVLDVAALFVAIGHEPSSELVEGQLELDESGYIKVRSPTTLTSVPGVFACGDVVDRIYRQAITAAGSGCAAALDAQRFLVERGTVIALGSRPARAVEAQGALVRDPDEESSMPGARSVGDDDFEDVVLRSDKPVLVDFWADWCGPCRLMAPVVDDLARSYGDRMVVVKVNVDASPRTAKRYDIVSLPALMLFGAGKVTWSLIGAKPKSKLVAELRPFLSAT